MELGQRRPLVFLFVAVTCRLFEGDTLSYRIVCVFFGVILLFVKIWRYTASQLFHSAYSVLLWHYAGKRSLQGSTLCRWYANPLIPEVAALQDRYFKLNLSFIHSIFV